ncbi:hypothetical protein EIL87_22760 [Saccharopolyspora rhizosphaerae]|uniref:DUF1707 domain-containing protein n=1 Tax=Saccharopolyspora rhizosphaerae TaxID=2492662 RepID=A0A3R8P0B2_9PSEU|nr:hypothetical protein [Saccharopolyspora rhizosphaerae]RRO13801.1 hypothetical protein EIL87_22760 [Saccharopolyspora rhizosphaerae]
MTWQDELQNLDAELAAGRISAEEYRQRRDAVLGRAQGGHAGQTPSNPDGFPAQDPTPPADPSSGGFPQQQPAQQQNPFPPAFSWGDVAKQQPQQGTGEETTQVVPNPYAQQQQPPADSGSTQVVNVPQTPPPPQWGQSQPPWAGQQQGPQGWGPVETTGTPWGDDLPGSSDSGEASWMRQGPEVFESAGKPGKGKLIAGLSIGAVLLVVVIVAVVFYFAGGATEPRGGTAAPPPPPPAPTTTPLPEPPAAKAPPATTQEVLVAANGPAHPWTGLLDVPNLQGAKGGLLQPKTVLDTAFQNGLVEGWFNGTDAVQPKTTLLALKLPDTNAAQTVVEKYLAAQQGLSEVEDLSYQGVSVVSTGATFRTAYVAHHYAVIIDVSGPAEQRDAAQQTFAGTLDQQLAHTPPTVRD